MKKILGIDVGTNSIGWALIQEGQSEEKSKILGMGSRIIPTDTAFLQKWSSGASAGETPNANRRGYRGGRRLIQRYKQRRSRLVEVSKLLNLIPNDYIIGQSKIHFDDAIKNEVAKEFGTEQFNEDLIIHYLRKKALSEALSLPYLFKVLYHLNQKRGFKSNRKEQLKEEGKRSTETILEVKKVTILSFEAVKDKNDKRTMYTVTIDKDGEILIGSTGDKNIVANVSKSIDLKITTKKTNSGESRTFTIPKLDDWTFKRDSLNDAIKKSGKTVGTFFYDNLKEGFFNADYYRIKDSIVLRELYEKEFDAIWQKQSELNPILRGNEKLQVVAEKLYPQNNQKQREILNCSYGDVFKKHVIYYQRPLKKQSVGTCSFELEKQVAPKSCPLYQEYRVWQQINNLKIRDVNSIDEKELTNEQKEEVFTHLQGSTTSDQSNILKLLFDKQAKKYALNFKEGQKIIGNATLKKLELVFKKHGFNKELICSNPEYLDKVWHVIHSVDTDNKHVEKALINYFKDKIPAFSPELAADLAKLDFESGYASLSTKAIKKLLPLMRVGKYFKKENIQGADTLAHISNIINRVIDDAIGDKTRQSLNHKTCIEDFQGLMQTHAVALVYNSKQIIEPYQTPESIQLFPNKALQNPVVEQVVNEALQVVKAIWQQYGKPNEIRVELARELKMSAKEKEDKTTAIAKAEKENEAIRNILREHKWGNPNSTHDVQKFRLGMEAAGKVVTKAEIEKYKLWIEAGFKSPYTGRAISFSQLFSDDIQIEHIFPRTRFYDDSMRNKTVCEAHINKEKDFATSFEYISKGSLKYPNELFKLDAFKKHIIETFPAHKAKRFLEETIPEGFVERQLNDTRIISVRLVEALKRVTENTYTSIGSVTDMLKEQWDLTDMFKRMLRDRYERVLIKSNLKIEENIFFKTVTNNNRERKILIIKGFTKRVDHRHHALDALVIACTSASHIKQLNTLNSLHKAHIEDRVQRNTAIKEDVKSLRQFKLPWVGFKEDTRTALESLIVSIKNKRKLATNKKHIYIIKKNGVKTVVEQEKGDNLVIRGKLHKEGLIGEACILKKEEDIKAIIKNCFDKNCFLLDKLNSTVVHEHQKATLLARFESHNFDLKAILLSLDKNPLTDVSTGKILRGITVQENKYAVKCAFDETLSLVRLRNIISQDLKKDIIEHIVEENAQLVVDKIPNAVIISEEMFYSKNDETDKLLVKAIENALNTEGVIRFNDKRKVKDRLNLLPNSKDKKRYFPVHKLRVFEDAGKLVGETNNIKLGHKRHAKSEENYCVAFYIDLRTGVRHKFAKISFFDAVTKIRLREPLFQKIPDCRLFTLYKGDLVYVPRKDEKINQIDWKNHKTLFDRIYKVTQTGNQMYFVPHNMATVITNKVEYGSQNALEIITEEDGQKTKIAEVCIKLKVDRLGVNIIPIFEDNGIKDIVT
jgi:CRISPR-associated endonuclease Csn1